MKLHKLLLPSAAGAIGALLLLPADSDAFTLIGGSLSLGQRDIRVFNNFTAAAANNNTIPDPSFPGYDGAELAIWKAAVEWGSRLHGDGSGDPIEGPIGSGGANFDPSWQGNATDAGGVNDNICSQLNGGGNGVYAFVEIPIADGWRMRFLRDRNGSGGIWSWQDGPGDEDGSNNRPDLQGIATHEYGHALGLGHTALGGSTMLGGTSPEGSSLARSIAGDDIAGVRAIYGTAVATKPVITALSVSGMQLEITGSNFDATTNEVWFTQITAGGNGTPVKAVNVPSRAAGTKITVAVPGNAGPGDVLVKNAGGGGAALSNAFPFEVSDPALGVFCNLSDNANSLCPCVNTGNGLGGCDNAETTGGARTEVGGFFPTGPSATVLVKNLPAANPLVVLLRSNAKLATPAVFGDGLRCIDLPVVRLSSRTASNGQSVHPFGHGKGPGTFYYQPWYRSAQPSFCTSAAAYNTGNGVSILWP